MRNKVSYISFTFDDFPRSALLVGGEILKRFGVRATYYASMGLMDQITPTGPIFRSEDLRDLSAAGHELGCHTFDHCDSWHTNPAVFEESVLRNKQALQELQFEIAAKTLSYPMSPPRPLTKRRMHSHFMACRGGGQTFNAGIADLNNLRAFFLEQSRDNSSRIERAIDHTCQAQGWLILATHDICDAPTPYGCTPTLFERVVRSVMRSGARVLPVGEVLAELHAQASLH
jgi:Polysaccharide deacetylase